MALLSAMAPDIAPAAAPGTGPVHRTAGSGFSGVATKNQRGHQATDSADRRANGGALTAFLGGLFGAGQKGIMKITVARQMMVR